MNSGESETAEPSVEKALSRPLAPHQALKKTPQIISVKTTTHRSMSAKTISRETMHIRA